MTKKYPNNYEEEQDWEVTPPMKSVYAPPEFMGFIRDSRHYCRGKAFEIPVEELKKDE